jgi:hypothetical protein
MFVHVKTEDLDIEIKDWSHASTKPSNYERARGTVNTSVVLRLEISISDQAPLLTPS